MSVDQTQHDAVRPDAGSAPAPAAVDQATFDADLSALVTAIGTLVSTVDSWAAAHEDFSGEDQSVKDAAAAVAAELEKIAPAAPVATDTTTTGSV